MKVIWPFCSLFFATTAIADAAEWTLRVGVHGAKPNTGQLIVSIFNDQKTYLKQPLYSKTVSVGDEKTQILEFMLESGTFAVSVIYDEDGNGELTTNMLGIPRESFGFSNNATASFGPPSWEDVRFKVQQPLTNITIQLGTAD